MTSGQQKQPKRRKRVKGSKHQSGGLAQHQAFAPLLGLWGTALGGGIMLVLPSRTVTAALGKTSIGMMGPAAQYVLAGMAALLLGAVLFIAASSVSRRSRKRADTPSIAEVASRRVRTIDPARDLGSRSLDEPVETPPFARPAPAPAPAREPAPAPAPAAAAQPDAAPLPPPLALDLAEFAQMPGRNGVWVEEAPALIHAPHHASLPAPQAAKPAAPARAPDPGAGAIARLRAAPTAALSLAEMVERFAAALHDHRAAAAGTPGHDRELTARDAALAEALKALAALSADPKAPSAGEPLRDALTRLQRVGGRA